MQNKNCMCKICGNEEQNKTYIIKEMMFGFKEEFRYFQCGSCGCLQIENIPENMAKYYPRQYYSFADFSAIKCDIYDNPISGFLRKKRTSYFMYHRDILGGFVFSMKPIGPPFSTYLVWLRKCNANFDSRVLDVGCGKGNLLLNLSWFGFRNLEGIDGYIDKDIVYNNGIRVFKKELSDIEGKYDVIMFHHSFEHMPEPYRVLRCVSGLLNKEGSLLIRMPLVSSYAWETYGVNWVQIDAPRHFFLHSLISIEIAAKKAGFKIKGITFDSTELQFWGSEQYTRGIPLLDERSYAVNPKESIFHGEDIRSFSLRAAELNKEKRGDQVCVYLIQTH